MRPAALPTSVRVHASCCTRAGAPLGGQQTLVLTRWDRARPAALGNLILLTRECAEGHDAADAPREAAEAAHSAALVRAVERTLRAAAQESEAWLAIC